MPPAHGTTTLQRRRATMIASALLALTAAGPAAAAKIQKGTSIHLDSGDVQGAVDDKTRKFLGIPYAAPPVGALRWRPPHPAPPRQTTLQATAFGGACPQIGS